VIRLTWVVAAAVLASAGRAALADDCLNTCGDLNGDGTVEFVDFAGFAECMGQPPGSSPECTCADLDGSGTIDVADFALFAALFGASSDEVPPYCTGASAATANLTAYRPQHGAGYAPFARTAVAEADEESATLGPGIRINAPGDSDPAGEDDLIEVALTLDPPGAALALWRSSPALRVWLTRDRQPGSEIPFSGDKADDLPLGPGETALTLWVEWAAAEHGVAVLSVEPPLASVAKDTLVFHTFQSIAMALGGEGQAPSDPADPNAGTFVVAVDQYRRGYDVHMYDEDNVTADGSGAVYDEVVNAVQNRAVAQVAIFGYSHGGGSTYDLAERLDIFRAGIGVFEIEFTSYVDSVSNNSDVDVGQELRRPPSTLYHLNHYQHGSFFEDFGLDGGPVPDSNPPPTGLDVETTPWGATSTHFEVDDYVQVRELIQTSLESLVLRFGKGPDVIESQRLRSGIAGVARGGLAVAYAPMILLFAANSVLAARVDQVTVAPNPAVQTAIGNVVAAPTPAARDAAFEQLRRLDAADRLGLIRQLVYYSSRAENTENAMVAGAVIRRLEISDDDLVRALVPVLKATEAGATAHERDEAAAFDRSVRNILGGVERRAPGRRPDFSAYREIIDEALRAKREPPAGLVQYLYEASPGEALLTMMRAYQLRDPRELKEILWVDHVVSDVLWKQEYGFLKTDQVEPAAVRELATLAARPDWWARLYVAEIMRQHPEFLQGGTVASLAGDANPLVRAAAEEARNATDGPR